ncbi:MAG: hypothetical protein ACOZE7_10625 [Pseudomonadota bacterium]
MNRDTARAILAAAALMTVQALMLAALAASTAHARTVYRCPSTSAGESITYQSAPCHEGAGHALQAADHRTPAQQAQAQANHDRQRAWLARQDTGTSADKARATSTKKRKTRRASTQASRAAAAPQAVPLTSHRIGQRPFEHLGQQVSTPDRALHKPGKRKQAHTTEITAKAPRQAGPQAHERVKPAQ